MICHQNHNSLKPANIYMYLTTFMKRKFKQWRSTIPPISTLEAQWDEPVSLTFHSALRKLYTEPSMVLPTKFRFIWPSSFREEYFFRNRPIRNKNCLWWPCLLTDQKLMSHLYRGPSMDASYQDSIHFVKQFQRRRFF